MFRIVLLTLITVSLAAPIRAGVTDPFRPQAGQGAPDDRAPATISSHARPISQPAKPWPRRRDLESTVIPNDGKVPQDIAVGDWNGDGITDLAIAYAYSDEVRWFFGGHRGMFIPGGAIAAGIHPGMMDDLPRKLWAADFDGDGFQDLAVLCSGLPAGSGGVPPATASLGILYGTPEGGFEPYQAVPLWPAAMNGAPPQYATSLTGAAVDSNGDMLLAVGFMDSHQVSLIRHQAGRRWAPPDIVDVATTGPGPVELALADLDFDGQTDLIALNRKELQIRPGTGPGQFGPATTVATGQALTALALADFDQDGAWDLAATDGGANCLHLFMGVDASGRSRSTSRIDFPAGSGPSRLLRYDANMDGRDDLAVLFLWSASGQILLGQPAGAAQPVQTAATFNTAQQPCALAPLNFDRDDRPDLAVVNQGDLSDSGNPDLSLIAAPALPGTGTHIVLRSYTNPGLTRTAWLTRPRGLARNAAQHRLWTIDRRGCKLVGFDENGTPQGMILLKFLFPPSQVEDPADVALDGTGDAWITDRLSGRLLHVDVHWPGAAKAGFSTAASGLGHPAGLAFDPGQNRLLVSDETQPCVTAFSLTGTVLATYQVAGGRALRDLAWNATTGRLWGTPEHEPDRLCEFSLDDTAGTATVTTTIQLASLAPLLEGQEIRAVAMDPDNHFWLLTDSGALIQGTPAPSLVSITELTPLCRTLAATAEPAGTTLLADGGLRSTLYRLRANLTKENTPGQFTSGTVNIVESFALRGPADAPLHIGGLARTANRIYVLDSVQGAVFLFDPHGQPAGSIAIPDLHGRHAQGLLVDAGSQHLWIACQGRLQEYTAAGQAVGGTPIPPTAPPTALSAGRQAGELVLLSAASNSILVRPAASGGAPDWQRILFQAMLPGRPFQALAVTPATPSASSWQVLGANEDAVVLANQGTASTAVGSGWTRYE